MSETTWRHDCSKLGRWLTLGAGFACMHCDTKAAKELSASQAREAELREKLEEKDERSKRIEAKIQIELNNLYKQLKDEQQLVFDYRDQVTKLEQRAEAAEAKLKEISEAPVVAISHQNTRIGKYLMYTDHGIGVIKAGDELIIRPTIELAI